MIWSLKVESRICLADVIMNKVFKNIILPLIPMVLWGLCGWREDDRIVTTADQAGTTALRKTFHDLGYKFKYIYDIIGLPSNSKKVANYAKAAIAAKGKDAVVNATVGALLDDNGDLVVMSSVAEAIQVLPPRISSWPAIISTSPS